MPVCDGLLKYHCFYVALPNAVCRKCCLSVLHVQGSASPRTSARNRCFRREFVFDSEFAVRLYYFCTLCGSLSGMFPPPPAPKLITVPCYVSQQLLVIDMIKASMLPPGPVVYVQPAIAAFPEQYSMGLNYSCACTTAVVNGSDSESTSHVARLA